MVDEFLAGESKALAVARLRHTGDDSTRELEIGGAFIAVGHDPQSQLITGQVDTDDEGYVVTKGRSTLTNLPGVFAAGDLVDHTYRQAITAAGSGCQAALDAEWYLRDNPAAVDAVVRATSCAPRRAKRDRPSTGSRLPGPLLPEGCRAPIGSPKSWVQAPGPPAPGMAPRLTPVPTSKKDGERMLRQWPGLAIHALTTAAGVSKPAAMFSATIDQLKPTALMRAEKFPPWAEAAVADHGVGPALRRAVQARVLVQAGQMTLGPLTVDQAHDSGLEDRARGPRDRGVGSRAGRRGRWRQGPRAPPPGRPP